MKWFTAQAAADNARVAHVAIDKPIGSDWAPDWVADFTGEQPAREFVQAITALGELDEINLDLNSPGGDVASGVRIYNYLKDHPAKVNVRVTGTAASIATVIMMAGDTRTMAVGSTIMTHRAATLAMGYYTAADMQELARNLETIDAAMVDVYAANTGQTADEINRLLDQGDTYMGADEALEWGFATDKDAKLQAVACADPKFYMQQLQMQGRINQLEAQVAPPVTDTPAGMTARDALALAFDLSPEQADEQAADLGDRIVALLGAPTVAGLREQHPEVVAAIEAEARASIDTSALTAEALAGERERVTAIIKACQTTNQPQLLDKLVGNGMPTQAAAEYVYDVAAASSNGQAIHNSHSPEGGHTKGIDHHAIYARLNRKTPA